MRLALSPALATPGPEPVPMPAPPPAPPRGPGLPPDIEDPPPPGGHVPVGDPALPPVTDGPLH